MSALAIIPARGGSKRLPRKNIIDFLGKPIISYTIEAAIQSECFERVVVSTEDDEIAAVAGACGAAVDWRNPALAADAVGVVDVCIDFLNRETAAARNWRVMACLYATAPMRGADDVRATASLLKDGVCDFAMAVTCFDLSPYHAMKFSSDSRLTPVFPDLIELQERDLPRLRVDNGSTYVVNVAEFQRYRTFYGPGLRGHDMPRTRSSDIDTQEDYELALWIARSSELHGASTARPDDPDLRKS
jgi:N-acylneuraminate cytidylyltransferase